MSIRGDGDAVNTYRTKLRRSSSEPFCSFRSEAGIHFPIERFTAKAFEACSHKDELSISKLAAVRFQVGDADQLRRLHDNTEQFDRLEHPLVRSEAVYARPVVTEVQRRVDMSSRVTVHLVELRVRRVTAGYLSIVACN